MSNIETTHQGYSRTAHSIPPSAPVKLGQALAEVRDVAGHFPPETLTACLLDIAERALNRAILEIQGGRGHA